MLLMEFGCLHATLCCLRNWSFCFMICRFADSDYVCISCRCCGLLLLIVLVFLVLCCYLIIVCFAFIVGLCLGFV